MDWIRQNKTAATIIGVATAGALGLGGMLYLAYTDYDQSLGQYQKLSSDIARMESASLYPSEANVKAKADGVAAYQVEVGELAKKLLDLQRLRKTDGAKEITDTDFQAKLKQLIAEIKTKAGQATTLPKDFALGFDVYTKSLPKSAQAANELDDYLDGVVAVVSAAIDSGVKSIDTLTRSELAIEKDGIPAPKHTPPPPKKAAPKPSKKKTKTAAPVKPPVEISQVVEKRQLILRMKLDQQPLQRLINTLSTPSQMPHFTIVRVLRVENEKQEGPIIGATPEELKDNPSAAHATATPASIATADPNKPQVVKDEVIAPTVAAKHDAFAVLGQENLVVYLEIDLVRFVDPASAEATTK